MFIRGGPRPRQRRRLYKSKSTGTQPIPTGSTAFPTESQLVSVLLKLEGKKSTDKTADHKTHFCKVMSRLQNKRFVHPVSSVEGLGKKPFTNYIMPVCVSYRIAWGSPSLDLYSRSVCPLGGGGRGERVVDRKSFFASTSTGLHFFS